MQPLRISLVIPCFNEEAMIDAFLAAVNASVVATNDKAFEFEFVFVDDGSQDNTLATLQYAQSHDRRIRIIELSRNFGKEAALTAGIDHATGDAVIPIDVDMQDPPELIPKLIEKWREGYDVVLAKRSSRESDSFGKRLSARLFYRFHNKLAAPSIPENVGDFRLIDRRVVEEIKRFPERRRFMKGLFAWVGFRTATVTYERLPRAAGKSSFNAWRLWNLAVEGITSFSTVPLRVWTYIGMMVSICAFSYGSFIVLRTIVFGRDVPGYASLLTGMLFLGGLQLVGLGVIGEYIGRIYEEAKGRPIYIVRNVHDDRDDADDIASKPT